jgi:hypothetical protein
MRGIPAVVVGLCALAGTAGEGAAGAPVPGQTAVWLYGAHRWHPDEVGTHLARLPVAAQRVYLSVEDGPRLVLDDPGDRGRVASVLDRAAETFGIEVDAMLLQDPAWVGDPEGALARTARVLAFDAARRAEGRRGFAGLHFDAEPQTEPAWICAEGPERGAMVRGLQALYARIARLAARPPAEGRLRLSAALPWWLGPLSVEVPQAAPRAWLADLDEVVLMVYGDPGGALVGETAAAVLRRVDDARLWAGSAAWPARRGLRLGLATYEYPDALALARAMDEVAGALAARPGFRGLAVFAHGQPFGAPLGAAVEGRVVDAAGRPVAGARVEAAGQHVRALPCGRFALRRLPAPAVEITVDAEGYRPARVTARGLVPGRQRELEPIVLERP